MVYMVSTFLMVFWQIKSLFSIVTVNYEDKAVVTAEFFHVFTFDLQDDFHGK